MPLAEAAIEAIEAIAAGGEGVGFAAPIGFASIVKLDADKEPKLLLEAKPLEEPFAAGAGVEAEAVVKSPKALVGERGPSAAGVATPKPGVAGEEREGVVLKSEISNAPAGGVGDEEKLVHSVGVGATTGAKDATGAAGAAGAAPKEVHPFGEPTGAASKSPKPALNPPLKPPFVGVGAERSPSRSPAPDDGRGAVRALEMVGAVAGDAV